MISHTILLQAIIILALLFFIVSKRGSRKEGFAQREKYVLKRGIDVYDTFTIPIQTHIHHSPQRAVFETKQIVLATQPDPNYSTFLDIGCGTGELAGELAKSGYDVYGLDKSKDMVSHCKSAHTQSHFVCGDATNPMEFEPDTFTHILCMDFTVYEFRNKLAFFKNCHTWLVPHGYLILHLVAPDKFQTIPPGADTSLVGNLQPHSSERITTTNIDFSDFKYKCDYDFKKLKEGMVIFTETFTDTATQHVRQNERELYMLPEPDILQLAEHCGFALHGQFSMQSFNQDKYQNVYILEKQ